MSLEDLVRDLADPAHQIAASKLTELSGLNVAQAKIVEAAWPEIGLRQRQQLVEELTGLAEDNVELNFEAAFQIALADRDPGLRKQAIRGLWEDERRETFDGLLKMLAGDPAAAVRAEAALALGRFVLRGEMGTLKPVDVERLENALQLVIEDEAEEVEVRGRALESVGAWSERWVTAAIEQAFEGADRRLRISAAHAMGRSCDPAWLPRLFDELENDDAEMRFEAVGAIGLIADESAIAHLIPLLHDEDAEVQATAVAALGEIGGDAAKEALEDLVAAGNPVLRELALDALSEVEFAEDPLSFSVRGDDTDATNGTS